MRLLAQLFDRREAAGLSVAIMFLVEASISSHERNGEQGMYTPQMNEEKDVRYIRAICAVLYYGLTLPAWFVVRWGRRNSWMMLPAALPAMPMAALLKTRPAPRSAWG
jgi:hypothetical protein